MQVDQKVSVHLMITIESSGAQRRFDHPVQWLFQYKLLIKIYIVFISFKGVSNLVSKITW
jgi:hypothetical protein